MEIYTIGFTQRTAGDFFTVLKQAGIRQLVDIRLNNVSQLAGFAKKNDLEYFLHEILDVKYVHMPMLAPTQAMLDAYRKAKGGWANYEQAFLALMAERRIEKELSPGLFRKPTVLLCSEHAAAHCHRRLVAEYLNARWGNVQAIHL